MLICLAIPLWARFPEPLTVGAFAPWGRRTTARIGISWAAKQIASYCADYTTDINGADRGRFPSPSAEDFSILVVWGTIASPAIQCIMYDLKYHSPSRTAVAAGLRLDEAVRLDSQSGGRFPGARLLGLQMLCEWVPES